jgi:hypothetical protein
MDAKSVEQVKPSGTWPEADLQQAKPSFSDRELNSVYEHYHKLLACDGLIITGSFALRIYGFPVGVKDLDLVIVNSSPEAEALIRKLEIPFREEYPPRPNHIRIVHGLPDKEMCVDFFMVKDQPYLKLADGRRVSLIPPIIAAKKRYGSLKQLVQRKKLSEMFYIPGEGKEFLDREQTKY